MTLNCNIPPDIPFFKGRHCPLFGKEGKGRFLELKDRYTSVHGISDDQDDPVDFPIDGIIDLHTFQPGEVKNLLPEYLHACRNKGILEVRIIHGKGTGMMRETVHSILKRMPEVVSFRLADETAGSWGATIAVLSTWQ
jgi:dsDNA-specific endonuclease/ATPase MutS2